MARAITWELGVDWNFDGTFTDETDRLLRAAGSSRFHPPAAAVTAGRGIVDQMTISLDNKDGRYSPLNTGGALYSSIQSGKAYHAPVYLRIGIGDSVEDVVFRGVVKIPTESGATWSDSNVIDIDCRSTDEAALQKRVSTTNSLFTQIHDEGWTESEIIARWLQEAGYADGTHFRSQANAASSGSDASLDPGLFVIPWAWLDDESPITDVWELAAACGGRFYFSPDNVDGGSGNVGSFCYENAYHWLSSPHTVSQETLDEDDFARLVPYYNDRELFDAVVVEASSRIVLGTAVLWEPDEAVTVAAGTSKEITAYLRQPAYNIDSISYVARSSGGADLTSDISVTSTVYAQRVEMEVTNAHATHAAILTTFQVNGKTVDGRPGIEERKTSVDSFWSSREGRTRTVRGNPYIQTRPQAQFLAEFLRDRHELPRLFFNAQGVPGDPERRLGDRVTLDDASVMSASRDTFILAMDWALSEQGYIQDLECIDADGLYASADYFVLDTDTLNGSAVLFY